MICSVLGSGLLDMISICMRNWNLKCWTFRDIAPHFTSAICQILKMKVNYEIMGMTKNRRLECAKIELRKLGVRNRGKKMKRLEHIAMARVTKALDMTWIFFIIWLCRVLDYFEFIWSLTQFLFLSSVSVLWFTACTNTTTNVGAIQFCCNSLLVVRFILLFFFVFSFRSPRFHATQKCHDV